MDRLSRLRHPFLHKRYFFVTVDLLTEYAGVDATEEESRRCLAIYRLLGPADEEARV
ncbi:MAG: hypothetical protein ABSA59_17290 [Terriglobia bacterium]|jgi:hypothetical protein